MTSEKGSRKDKNQNIQVFVRLRPLNQREKDIRSLGVVEVVNGREVVVRQSNQVSHNKKFTFDRAFPPHSKQVEVYQEVVSPLIEEVLAGYNCTVFAYGQTGTGKTHTMVGEAAPNETSWQNDPEAGIIPRALSQLFDELRLTNTEYTVRVSYLELYNEELFDLLSSSEDNSKLRIYEDVTRKGSNIVNGLEEITVYNKNEVYKIMAQGQERKKVASTLMNAQSSNQSTEKKVFRSHTVFTIVVHMKENSPEGEELVKIGKLNLVDLAGSENISKAGSDNPAKKERARECVNINQSLLTLGRVITALVERHPHIPYRESKLTRILQESLGGRTKTSIIATISPGHKDLEETLSTLEYANRAKNIQNKPEVNQKMTKKAILKEYAEEIDKLKRDLQAARDKNGIYLAAETYTEMTFKQEEQRKEIQDLILKQRAMEEEKAKVEKMFGELSGKLSAEQQKLQETVTILANTENQLSTTKTMLEKTKQHFLEQRHLVERQQHTERELAAQAQQILRAAEQAAGDATYLHDTVDRRSCVESSNLEVTRAYRQMSAQRREHLARASNQHQADINAALLDIHHVANKFTNNTQGTLAKSNQTIEEILHLENETFDKVKSLTTELQNSLEAMTSSSKASITATMTSHHGDVRVALANIAHYLGACLQRAADVDMCGDLDKFLQYWNSDATSRLSSLETTTSRWASACRESAQRHEAHARLLADLLRHKRQHFEERVTERLNLISEDKQETERRIARQLSNIESEKRELEEELAAWVEAKRRKLEQQHAQRMAEIEEEKRQYQKKVDSYVEWLNTMKEENEKEIEQLLSELEKSETDSREHQITVHELREDCGKSNKYMVSACGELTVNALKIVQQVKENLVNNMRDINGYFAEETTKTLSQTEEKLQGVTSSVCDTLDAHTHSCTQSVDALALQIQNTTSANISAISTLSTYNNDLLSTTAQQQAHQDEALMLLQQHTQRHTDAVAEELAALQKIEEDCLTHQYKVYSPTGLTPARKTYEYPRNLAATSPHERILARFRANGHDDSITIINSDSESTDSEESPNTTTETQPERAHIVKSTSESDIFTQRKTQGKENINNSMTFKKPSKLPSLSARKTTPLVDKN